MFPRPKHLSEQLQCSWFFLNRYPVNLIHIICLVIGTFFVSVNDTP